MNVALEIALVLVFAAHLWCMNVAAAGPVVCLWLKRRQRRRNDEAAGKLGYWLAKQSLWGVLLGTVLGLVSFGLLLALDGGAYWHSFSRIPVRRIGFGITELFFFAAGLAVYCRAWNTWGMTRPYLHSGLGILAAGNLIYHFPVLFAAVTVLPFRHDLTGKELNYGALMSLFGDGQTLARTAHFLLASASAAGASMMLFGSLEPNRRELGDANLQRLATWGGRLALSASLLQIPGGVSLLFALPRSQYDRLLGGDWWATGLFAVSLFVTLSMLHYLAIVALGASDARHRANAVRLMLVVVVLMTGARQRAGWEQGRAVARGAAAPFQATANDGLNAAGIRK